MNIHWLSMVQNYIHLPRRSFHTDDFYWICLLSYINTILYRVIKTELLNIYFLNARILAILKCKGNMELNQKWRFYDILRGFRIGIFLLISHESHGNNRELTTHLVGHARSLTELSLDKYAKSFWNLPTLVDVCYWLRHMIT